MSEIKSFHKDLILVERKQILQAPTNLMMECWRKKGLLEPLLTPLMFIGIQVDYGNIQTNWWNMTAIWWTSNHKKLIIEKRMETDINDVTRAPLSKRYISSTAVAVYIPKSILYWNFYCHDIRRLMNELKPFLTLIIMVEREDFYKANM